MFKVGMCEQTPCTTIQRLKSYPKNSQVCCVICVPNDSVNIFEKHMINHFMKTFTLIRGKEYFIGEDHQVVTSFVNKINELLCDRTITLCDIKTNSSSVQHKKTKETHELTNDDIKLLTETIHNTNDKDLCINLDVVSKWLGVQKFNLLQTLRDSYKETLDFVITKSSDPNLKHRKYNNYKLVLITPDTFKRLCMKSRSRNAEQIRTYFIQKSGLTT
jgi:phage anti-repressor protein